MKVAIIGGGASGLFCAGEINKNIEVTIFEKNSTLGKKLLITGNGRCNVTNNKSSNDFLNNVITNSKFLYSCINSFLPIDLINNLKENGIELVEEDDNKIYPKSSKSKTILDFFVNRLKSNVTIKTDCEVTDIVKTDNGFIINTANNQEYYDIVIIATGGKSYPIMGSTGDGYEFAKNFGHNIQSTRQSLCAMLSDDAILKPCQGVQFNCSAKIIDDNGEKYCEDNGGLMFTNFGVSGPLIFKLSAKYTGQKINGKILAIDFLKDCTNSELNKQLEEFIKKFPKEEIFQFLAPYLIKRFANELKNAHYELLSTKGANLTKEMREEIIQLLKSFKIKISDFDGFGRAVVTRGGVDVKEINPKTMESKLVNGLYFLGEVIDVDALTGGYSLHIAFATAFACAKHINKIVNN